MNISSKHSHLACDFILNPIQIRNTCNLRVDSYTDISRSVISPPHADDEPWPQGFFYIGQKILSKKTPDVFYNLHNGAKSEISGASHTTGATEFMCNTIVFGSACPNGKVCLDDNSCITTETRKATGFICQQFFWAVPLFAAALPIPCACPLRTLWPLSCLLAFTMKFNQRYYCINTWIILYSYILALFSFLLRLKIFYFPRMITHLSLLVSLNTNLIVWCQIKIKNFKWI